MNSDKIIKFIFILGIIYLFFSCHYYEKMTNLNDDDTNELKFNLEGIKVDYHLVLLNELFKENSDENKALRKLVIPEKNDDGSVVVINGKESKSFFESKLGFNLRDKNGNYLDGMIGNLITLVDKETLDKANQNLAEDDKIKPLKLKVYKGWNKKTLMIPRKGYLGVVDELENEEGGDKTNELKLVSLYDDSENVSGYINFRKENSTDKFGAVELKLNLKNKKEQKIKKILLLNYDLNSKLDSSKLKEVNKSLDKNINLKKLKIIN